MAFESVINAGLTNFVLDAVYLGDLEAKTGYDKEVALSFAAGIGARMSKGGLKTGFRSLGAIQVAERFFAGDTAGAAQAASGYLAGTYGARWAKKAIVNSSDKLIKKIATGKITGAGIRAVSKVATRVLPKFAITALGSLARGALKLISKLAWPVAIAWTIYDVGKAIYDWIKGRRKSEVEL